MSMISRIIIFSIFLISGNLFASDGISDVIIHFEEKPFKDSQIFCPDDTSIKPRASDFEIINYALMSSNQGHRYALITIENTSTGQRSMNGDHLVATLANCKRIHPVNFELKFKGSETITKEVNFGLFRFPIIKVSSDQ